MTYIYTHAIAINTSCNDESWFYYYMSICVYHWDLPSLVQFVLNLLIMKHTVIRYSHNKCRASILVIVLYVVLMVTFFTFFTFSYHLLSYRNPSLYLFDHKLPFDLLRIMLYCQLLFFCPRIQWWLRWFGFLLYSIGVFSNHNSCQNREIPNHQSNHQLTLSWFQNYQFDGESIVLPVYHALIPFPLSGI